MEVKEKDEIFNEEVRKAKLKARKFELQWLKSINASANKIPEHVKLAFVSYNLLLEMPRQYARLYRITQDKKKMKELSGKLVLLKKKHEQDRSRLNIDLEIEDQLAWYSSQFQFLQLWDKAAEKGEGYAAGFKEGYNTGCTYTTKFNNIRFDSITKQQEKLYSKQENEEDELIAKYEKS
jgi:hypothetical protein